MVRRAGLGSLGKSKNYYQYNYIDVVQKLVPSVYQDTDASIFGQEEDILYSVLGKVILAAKDALTLIPLSATAPAYTLSGIQQQFIPRNNMTDIEPYLFENKILKAFGRRLSDFKSITDWSNYVSGTLLPSIKLNYPSASFVSGVKANINAAVSSAGAAHQYLIDNLSWVYLLNFEGPDQSTLSGFDPSTISKDLLVSSTFLGKSIQEVDGVKGLFEYIWRNKEVQTASGMRYIPPVFNQTSSTVSANIYASGTQLLDGLKTLIGVWYNPNDDASTELQTQLELLTSLGTYDSKKITAGPFQRFLKALSFAVYDVNSLVDDIGTLLDVDRCDKRFLNYLGSLIGWKVLTGDIDRWRGQLRQAVYLYKAKGTRKALETAVSLMFPEAGFNAADATEETWESYIPRLIYYLIATESKVLNDPNYDPTSYDSGDPNNPATTVSINGVNAVSSIEGDPLFDSDDHDNNYRFATDYVLDSLQHATNAITINGVPYAASSWDPDGNGEPFAGFEHRGAFVPVPPWENDRFYDTTYTTMTQLSYVSSLLSENRSNGGLEVPLEYVKGFTQHVLDNNLNSSMMAGLNLKWKFYTTSSIQPPNFDTVVSGGRAKDISLKDYWNSKGSTLLTIIETSALTQSLSPGVSGTIDYKGAASGDFSYKADTDEIVYVVGQIFRQFIPFHALVKFYAIDDFQDRADVAGSGSREGFVYAAVKDNLVDQDDQILRNFVLSGYVASSVTGLDAPSSNRRVFTGVPRTSRRRRNLEYIIPGAAYYRDGKSMPIARAFVGSSTENPGYASSVIDYGTGPEGGQLEVIFSSVNNYMNVSSFIPLGYNFSTGSYFSTKGPDAWIYDTSNFLALSGLNMQEQGAATRARLADTSASYYGIDVSSTYPCRALGYVSGISLMGPLDRTAMDYSTCAIYGTVLRNQTSIDMVPSLAPSSIANVVLGSLFWDLWQKHQRYFGGTNFNYIYDAYSASGALERFSRAGGRSLGAQLEGPGFFNSNFAVQGLLAKGDFGSASAFKGEPDLISKYPQWKNIVAKEEAAGKEYEAFSGDIVKIQSPVSFGAKANENSRVKYPDYADTSSSRWAMNSVVSGVSLVGRDEPDARPSWAVYNTHQWGSFNTSSNATNALGELPGTISLFNEKRSESPPNMTANKSNAIGIRFSLNQGREYLANPQFRWKSATTNANAKGEETDTPWKSNPSASGISGWALQGANTSKYDGTEWHTGDLWTGENVFASAGYFLSGINPDTDQYYLSATASGAPLWRGQRSSYIRSQKGTNHGGENANLYGLVPGRKYKLTVQFMTRDADASGVSVVLKRQNPDSNGRDTLFNRSGGWSVGTNENNTCPVLAPGNNQGLFNTSSLDINVSSTFLPYDRYDLQIAPIGPNNGSWVERMTRYFFKEIKLEEYDTSPTKNRLIPEKDYELSVRFRHHPNPNDDNALIGIRIRADNIPVNWNNTENGYDSEHQPFFKGKGNSLAFDIVDNQWKNIIESDYRYWDPGNPGAGGLNNDTGRLKNLYYEFKMDSDFISTDPNDSDWKIVTIPFNTKNNNINSPDQWDDYSTGTYKKFIYKNGKPLHNVDTVYHVEVGKFSFDEYNTPASDRTFLTVDKVSFKLKNSYDELLNFYNFEGLDSLFRKFDLQLSGDSSRNSYYSASAYQTSGGSRLSYEEEYGNIYSGTVDTTNIYGDASGVVYNLTDD